MTIANSIFLHRRRTIAFWLLASTLIILMLSGLIFRIQLNKATQHIVNDFSFMQEEVINLILKKDITALEKILHVIDTDSLASMRIERGGQIFASYPNDDLDGDRCADPTVLPINHYNVQVGRVVLCLNKSQIIFKTVSSPSVVAIFCLLAILILAASLLPYIGYQKGLTQLVRKLDARNESLQACDLKGLDDPIVSYFLRTFEEAMVNRLAAERAALSEEIARQVSHDIRSPLMALKTIIQFSKEELSAEKSVMLTTVCKRISKIADDLLASTRKKSNKRAASEVHDIRKIIKKCVLEKELEFKNEHFRIDMDLQSVEMRASLDESEFSRMLSNLLNNAIEASAGRLVILRARLTHETIHVSVEDDGPGFSNELQRLINSSSAVVPEVTTTKVNGNGLGLTHAIKTMRTFGGRLSVKTLFSGMNAVHLELPRVG